MIFGCFPSFSCNLDINKSYNMSENNTIHNIVLANMIRLREEKRWKKSDLARHADVDASHISNIENGKKQMGLSLLSRIAYALGVEPYEMIREYDPADINLLERLKMIESLDPLKKQAIEQMINAFLRESKM